MDTSLFLSHWDDPSPRCVNVSCVKKLKNYHLMGVRFLYNCFRKQQKGAVLNHEHGMNFQLQVSAFLNAFSDSIAIVHSVLIICSSEAIYKWHYHLTNDAGYDVMVLSATNVDDIVESTQQFVILSTVDNTSILRKLKEKDLFCVVVDNLDQLIAKSIVKQIKGHFNIGLTHRSFLRFPNQKLFWSMLNWSNPGAVGKSMWGISMACGNVELQKFVNIKYNVT